VPDGQTQVVCLIDIGTQSTVCSITEGKVLKTSHSFDIAGSYVLEHALGKLPLDADMVREIKKKFGLKFFSMTKNEHANMIRGAFLSALESITKEVGLMIQGYGRLDNKEISKIIVSGGAALIPGVVELFKDCFKCSVEIADPFKDISYPTMLAPELQKIAPAYTVAIGMARRGLMAQQQAKKE